MDEAQLWDRFHKAEKIINRPQDYKVCEGCESIVKRRAATCPNGHSYRFDDNPKAVAFYAGVLASRDQLSVTEEDMY